MTERVDASPTKEFFVNMITRDISLEDCVLDLLDNSIDGARDSLHRRGKLKDNATNHNSLKGYWAKVFFDEKGFSIEDNCGGISIDKATEYAFHFGRRPDAPPDVEGTIGLYGIGMKRAVLKMGKHITIRSSTEKEAFEVNINVDKWLEKPTDWDFVLERKEVWDEPGTKIKVGQLYPQIADKFGDNTFEVGLSEIVARDYAFVLEDGFNIWLNNSEVERYHFELRESEAIKPVRISYVDEETDVKVEISAGMADVPSEAISAEEEVESQTRRETDYYGWFVVCNNRVVLAADRTERTIWGDDKYTRWHPQYNGFMGIVHFTSDNPDNLPWTTTKRDVDESNSIYRRAVVLMKEATRPWIAYTSARKKDLKKAKSFERVAVAKPIEQLAPREQMLLPEIESRPRVKVATIQYQKPLSEVNKVRRTLGHSRLAYTEVGRLTFEYYMENEVID